MTASPTRRLIRAVFWIAVGLVSLPWMLLAAAQLPAARRWLVAEGAAWLAEELDVRLEIDEVARLDPWGIELRRVTVRAPAMGWEGSVEHVFVQLRPFGLWNRQLRVTQLRVAGVRALIRRVPSRPARPPAPAARGSPWSFSLEDVELQDALFAVVGFGPAWSAYVDTLRGSGDLGNRVRVALERTRLQVGHEGRLWLTLDEGLGTYDTQEGGLVALRGELVNAPLAAEAHLKRWSDVTPWPVAAAQLRLGGVNAHTLRELGMAAGPRLLTPVELGLAARSEGEQLELVAFVRSEHAFVQSEARFRPHAAHAITHVWVPSLARLGEGLPSRRLRATVASDLRDREGHGFALSLGWSDLAIDATPIPDGSLALEYRAPRLALQTVRWVDFGRSLQLSGSYDTHAARGQLHLTARSFPLARLARPLGVDLSGLAEGDLTLIRRESGLLTAEARLRMSNVRGPDQVRADTLALEGEARGSLQHPEGELLFEARGLRRGDLHLERARARLSARGNRLESKLEAFGPELAIHAEVSGTRSGRELRMQSHGHLKLRHEHVVFALPELAYGARGVVWRGLRISSEHGRLLTTGQVTRRMAELDIRLLEAKLTGQPELDALLHVRADRKQRILEGTLSAWGLDGLTLQAGVNGHWPRKLPSLVQALEGADGQAYLRADLPIARLTAPFAASSSWAPSNGHLTARVDARGSLKEPHLQARLSGALESPSEPNAAPDSFISHLLVEPSGAVFDMEARDAHGTLLDLRAQLEGSPLATVRELSSKRWPAAIRMRANAELSPRELSELRGIPGYLARRFGFALPVMLGGELAFDSRSEQPRGLLRLHASGQAEALDPRCKPGKLGAELLAKLDASSLAAHLTARPPRGGPVVAQLRVPWLAAVPAGTAQSSPARAPAFDWAASTLALTGEDLDMSSFPHLCQIESGKTFLEAKASHLGTEQLALDVNLKVDELGTSGAPRARLLTRTRIDGSKLSLRAALAVSGSPGATLEANLPLRHVATRPTLAPDAPFTLRLRAVDLPLALPAQFAQGLGRVQGTITADADVRGTLAAPDARGFVALDHVSFSLASLAQPVRDVNGRIELNGDTLTIPALSARDRDGKVEVSGRAKLARSGLADANFRVRADKFPLRQQGLIMGRLSLDAGITARSQAPGRLAIDTQIASGRFEYTAKRNKQVQDLDPHPEVRVFGPPSTAVPKTGSGTGKPLEIARLELKSRRDLVIQGRDFSVSLSVDLVFSNLEQKPRLEGRARVRRGTLDVFGKSFNVLNGEVRFTGELPADPEFDLRASYTPPTGGEALIIQVSGRAGNPSVSFSGAANTPEQALAVLSGVPETDAQIAAQADARSVALGITAGILSMTARRELGNWVPIVSVTSSQGGQTSQARAGFEASKLIPPFMRSFARSAFIEGVVGPTQQGTPGSTIGLGVRLEIILPHSLVSSFSYGPGTAWGSDLMWVP